MPGAPLRLLVLAPSWVGDVAMATPALRLIRRSLPGCFIGGLVRPGIDALLGGSDFFDELHVERASGVLGPKFVAAKVRPRRYDTALLLTNSFSTALIVRLAGIPRRVGFDRDARGLLLTHRLDAPRRPGGGWAPISAVDYYLTAARALLELSGVPPPTTPSGSIYLELATTPTEEHAADDLLARAGVAPGSPMVVLNPGANDPAKRWPADRFAALARHLDAAHGLTPLVNGSPAEAELVASIVAAAPGSVALPSHGVTLGSLKALLRRSRLLVTNDTGPRHVAAALGVPVVSLLGPTDHRWAIIPTRPGAPERTLLADPTLPPEEVANDHPDRCRIDRITLARAVEAVEALLGPPAPEVLRPAASAGRDDRAS